MVEAEPKVATPSRGSEACGGSRSAGSSGAVGAGGEGGEAGGVRGNGDDEWVEMMWRPIPLLGCQPAAREQPSTAQQLTTRGAAKLRVPSCSVPSCTSRGELL